MIYPENKTNKSTTNIQEPVLKVKEPQFTTKVPDTELPRVRNTKIRIYKSEHRD